LNSADAFSFSISGSHTEGSINRYADYLSRANTALGRFGGWLGEQAARNMESFDNFLQSRAWEMGKRLLNKEDGEFVGRYSIGYLGSVNAQQQADGYMRDVIMANPILQQLYLDGEIEGYGGEFSHFCSGIGADNLIWRRMYDGVLNLTKQDDVNHLSRVSYNDSAVGKYSYRDKVYAHKTHAASNHHIATTQFDITSSQGNKRKSFLDVEEE
jgi:hypothetical protein